MESNKQVYIPKHTNQLKQIHTSHHIHTLTFRNKQANNHIHVCTIVSRIGTENRANSFDFCLFWKLCVEISGDTDFDHI